MRRIRTALVALFALALAGPTSAAAAPTCDGKAATIFGSRGAYVQGTDSADVIVSNGADFVLGLGGDDRICVTGTSPGEDISVNAGYGHDRVFVRTTVPHDVSAALDQGRDLYIGGPGRDWVHGGPSGYYPKVGPRDAAVDRIATGPGADHVTIGQADIPTQDIVRLGQHSDRLTVIEADELYGGTGSDSADGRAGNDLCRAETRRSCERD